MKSQSDRESMKAGTLRRINGLGTGAIWTETSQPHGRRPNAAHGRQQDSAHPRRPSAAHGRQPNAEHPLRPNAARSRQHPNPRSAARLLLFPLLVVLAVTAISCSSDYEVGRRYQAEKALAEADWEYRNYQIRPGDVSEAQWKELAQTYEQVAQEYTKPVGAVEADSTVLLTQTLAARALFSAARVYAQMGDSTHVEQIFETMATNYADVPQVAAEVNLAQAGVAEGRRDFAQAAALYKKVVETTEPAPGLPNAAGAVLELPLRIARLRAVAAGVAGIDPETGEPTGEQLDPVDRVPYYDDAKAYYEQQVRDHDGTRIQIESQAHLAELYADTGDWHEATQALRELERQLTRMEEPPRQPCEVRFAIAGIQMRTGLPPDSARVTLTSLLEEYPDCPIAPQTLAALANNAIQRNQVNEAIEYLERIADEYENETDTAAQAILMKGQLLEQNDRWQEALEAFRTLRTEYPITQAALTAPLEIARHYDRTGNEEAEATALEQAERDYREFISRYPPGPSSLFARERLAQTLVLREKMSEAIDVLVELGSEMQGTRQGASTLIAAARMAFADLADTARAAAILDDVGKAYSEVDVGVWATNEAVRLRESMTTEE